MADLHQDGAGSGADFDLSQFYQIFFEEASENLDQMEKMLVGLDLSAANDEELNGIFRCAHSIKGGAATFGFSDVTALTHRMESLLDRLRRHEITPIPEMVDVLLESADASRSLLARHQAGDEGEAVSTAELVMRIEALAQGLTVMPTVDRGSPASPPAPVAAMAVAAPVFAPASVPVPEPEVPALVSAAAAIATGQPEGERVLHVRIGPLARQEMADAI
ncbi:MAG: Hpt domain-containing protein, partial [Comamonas sp.]